MTIFPPKKTLVIAEIANSHEGNILIAKKLVNAACDANADAIKFQKFYADELLEKNHSQFNHFKKLEMRLKDWSDLINYSKKRKIKVFVDVFGLKSAKEIYKLKVDGFKIHSTDITNPNLLNFFAKKTIPLLLSTAGCTRNEISEALKILNPSNREIVLMHGFQGFPTKVEDLHLRRINSLKKYFDLPVGLMDHISGDSPLSLIIPLLGIASGVEIIEKHITLNRDDKGIDYFSALNPNEFKKMISLIRLSEKSFGSPEFDLGKNELEYRHLQKKNAISKQIIPNNSKLSTSMFDYKRTNSSKESLPFFEFNGQTSSKQITSGKLLLKNNLKFGNKKVAAIVACRVDSERLFAKPIQNLKNFSILHHLITQIKTSKQIQEIVLAISENPGNEIFVNFAKEHNLKFVLGDDHDVLQRLIIGAKFVDADIVFRVTSENPYIYWQGIDKLITNHIKGKYDFSFYKDLPIGSSYEIINLQTLEKSHQAGKKKHRSELCSLYVFEHKKSFKIQTLLPPKNLQVPQLRLTVDTPEDLVLARLINKQLGNSLKPIPLLKIIKFLKNRDDLISINSDIPLGVTRIWN